MSFLQSFEETCNWHSLRIIIKDQTDVYLMLVVSFLGLKGSGRTTFLALLYDSIIRNVNKSTEGARSQSRVYIEPYYQKILGELRNSLLMGEWPSNSNKEDRSEFIIRLGKEGGILRSREIIDIRFIDFHNSPFRDTSKEAISLSLRDDIIDAMDLTNAWVLFLDIGQIRINKGTGEIKARDSYDKAMAGLVSSFLIQFDGLGPTSLTKNPHFFLICSKFDYFVNKLQREAGLPSKPPKPKGSGRSSNINESNGQRKEYVRRLLFKYYPATSKAFFSNAAFTHESKIDIPAFFSGIRTVRNQQGERIPAIDDVNSPSRLKDKPNEMIAFMEYLTSNIEWSRTP